MSVLIQSYLGDEHARAVQWALETCGVRCDIWQPSLFPAAAHVSISPCETSENRSDEIVGVPLAPHPTRSHQESRADPGVFRIMWLRRRGGRLHHPHLKPGDGRWVERECRNALYAIEVLAARKLLCINDPKAASWAGNKAMQLALARDAGLSVPATLISNDPISVKRFYDSHERIIAKPFDIAIWNETDDYKVCKSYVSYASHLKRLDEDLYPSIRSCPTIYQEYIQKVSDVRTLICGERIVSIEIYSQKTKYGQIDWRAAQYPQEQFSSGPFNIDHYTRRKLIRYMKLIGLKMGCIDWARKSDGTLVFLEINPQGQWLWMEDLVPQSRALMVFTAFLLDELGAPLPHDAASTITLDRFQGSPFHALLLEERASSRAGLGAVEAIRG